jgi:hypothetical protein
VQNDPNGWVIHSADGSRAAYVEHVLVITDADQRSRARLITSALWFRARSLCTPRRTLSRLALTATSPAPRIPGARIGRRSHRGHKVCDGAMTGSAVQPGCRRFAARQKEDVHERSN